MDPLTILLFLITGVVAGSLAGMLGIGGGIIYMPVLLTYFKILPLPDNSIPIVAVSTSLSIIVFSVINGARTHWKHKMLDIQALPYLVGSGAVGAIIASFGLTAISIGKFEILYCIFLYSVGIKTLIPLKEKEMSEDSQSVRITKFLFIGFTAGVISAFFGIGGGLVMVPFLHYMARFKMGKAIGTSSGYVFFISVISLITYLFHSQSLTEVPENVIGSIYWPALVITFPVAFFFNKVGAKLTHKLPGAKIKLIFGVFVVGVATYKLVNILMG